MAGIWEGFAIGLTWGTLYKYAIETARWDSWEKRSLCLKLGTEYSGSIIAGFTTWYMSGMTGTGWRTVENNSLEVFLVSMSFTWIVGKRWKYPRTGFSQLPWYCWKAGSLYQRNGLYPCGIHACYGISVRSGAGDTRLPDFMRLPHASALRRILCLIRWASSESYRGYSGLGSFLIFRRCQRLTIDAGLASLWTWRSEKGFHPDWKSHIFNYGRNEAEIFPDLQCDVLGWALSCRRTQGRCCNSMLHLDYPRNEGEWFSNIYGGNVNLEAKASLQEFNTAVYKEFETVLWLLRRKAQISLTNRFTRVG